MSFIFESKTLFSAFAAGSFPESVSDINLIIANTCLSNQSELKRASAPHSHKLSETSCVSLWFDARDGEDDNDWVKTSCLESRMSSVEGLSAFGQFDIWLSVSCTGFIEFSCIMNGIILYSTAKNIVIKLLCHTQKWSFIHCHVTKFWSKIQNFIWNSTGDFKI